MAGKIIHDIPHQVQFQDVVQEARLVADAVLLATVISEIRSPTKNLFLFTRQTSVLVPAFCDLRAGGKFK